MDPEPSERTLVVLKPDAVQRRLIGELIARFERKGLRVAGMKMLQLSNSRAAQMYDVHRGKEFHDRLMRFVTSGPVVALVIVGYEAIEVVRGMMGPTCGREAPAGTIRGDYGMARRLNLVHGSDSVESAEREIPVFFEPDEILDYDLTMDAWTYGD